MTFTNDATRPYAEVIGDPIAHSKSPLIHGFWLEVLGIDADYRATHVTPEALPGYFAQRRADPHWRGCNITIPHKLAALDHVEDRGGVRGTIGAINLALRVDALDDEGDAIIGTNTDAGGFYAPIAGLDLSGAPVTVIGAGGAARAILFALSKIGVGPVTILNRNVLKAAALLATFGLKGQALPLNAGIGPCALLVNASALGMAGQPPLDVDLSALPEDAVVYDVVYAPLETALLKAARARDLETVDGLDMLIGQAALAFEMLFGAEPPRDRDEDLRALLTK
ncbi:shikimate dehydrogenase [Sphingomonas sp. Leaf17]|uniref:shikimate dehydrogenase family protein n=1 Tax=Sphingomonas sp. Leaf17 TaxID=1735683 RepID=UPI0006FF08BA|nr:shikimate dehydrogenase [Sphingomonas sp. Leaf17]KQM62496.1 shikimate dehydrogenase [Sphingomonas sp. Leaf17]